MKTKKIYFKTSPQQALNRGRIHREIEQIHAKSLEIAKQEILSQYHLIWLLALRDEFGFADSRARRVLEKFIQINEDIADGLISFTDIKDTIKDEIGEDFYNTYIRLDWDVRDDNKN